MTGAQFDQAWADDLISCGLRAGAGRDFQGLESLFVRHGSRQGDAVALTFDDGPVDRTAEAVSILDDHGAKGTFFFVGEKVRGREDLVLRMTAAGHEVGNHSSHHRLFPDPSDIRATSRLLAGVAGQPPRVYRPPFGAIDTATAEAAREAGMQSVHWDVDSEDVFPVYRGLEAREVYRNVVGGVIPGSIVLLHDGQPWSRAIEALPAILTTLRERGLRAVTVSELLTGASERGTGGPPPDGRAGSAPDRDDRSPAARPGRRRWWPPGLRRRGPPSPGGVPSSWKLTPSPIAKREIMAMSAEDVVDVLERWTPSGRVGDPTLEGLERALARRVISTPKQFADLADRLAKVEAARLRITLNALTRAVTHGFQIEWDAALTLVTATSTAGDDEAGRLSRPGGGDASERSRARREGGRLIATVLASGNHPPDDLGESLWSYLEQLSSEGLPPDLAREDAGIDEETRSLALEAIIGIGVRERAHGTERAALEWQPDVLASLDAHLDASWEPSSTVRAVYGRHLAKLHSLDPAWLEGRIAAIFPSDPGLAHLREAAWSEYLAWGASHRVLAGLLEEQYRRSVAELPPPSGQRLALHHDADDPPRERGRILARKLATLYAAGALDLSGGGLLRAFIDRAAPDHLGYFVRFVGLVTRDGALEGDVPGRLVELWAVVEDRAARLDAGDRALVLSRFGFWYQADALDPDWRDEKLLELLRAGTLPEVPFRVFGRVAERAAVAPGRAVEIARSYLELARDDWEVRSIAEPVVEVLEAGRRSGDPEVHRRLGELEAGLKSVSPAPALSPAI